MTLPRFATGDCRVPNGDCPDYRVRIDGQLTTQNRMLSRADMSFWGISASDILPPPGMRLEFLSNGEPVFTPTIPPGLRIQPCGDCDCADPTAPPGLAADCDCHCHHKEPTR